jgi:small conductance mechanosensitive channel
MKWLGMLLLAVASGRGALPVVAQTPAPAGATDTANQPAPASTPNPTTPDAAANPAVNPPANPPPPVDVPRLPLTEVERIAALEKTLADDSKQLEKLNADLAKRETEYATAVKEFNDLKTQVEVEQAALADLRKSSDNSVAISRSEKALEALQQKMMLAKERVELAVAERKGAQSSIAVLTEKIGQEQAALRELKGNDQPPAVDSTAPPPVPAETSPAEKKEPTPPALPTPESVLSGSGEPKKSDETKPAPISERAAKAETEATEKQAAADKAKRSVEEIAKRKQTLEESIALERTRLSTAYKRHENLSQTLQTLESEFYGDLRKGKEYASLEDVSKQLADTRARLEETSDIIQDHNERLQVLQAQYADVQQEELELAREATEKEAQAAAALRKSWWITITDYGMIVLPQVGVVLLVLFTLHWLLRGASKRMVTFLTRNARGTPLERENHAKTLVSVTENAAYTALYVGGALVVANVLRIPVAPLMGGVAVVGLAVAFGAQNLIRDYFYGFMILAENQYKIGDVITIGDMTGTVERITLRITVLRDLEGKVYFIPNGQITSVINLTHEWSRVVLDIGVAYKEKVDKVMAVLLELANELCHDPAFESSILQDPELLGVEALGDSAVVIRICLVTRPDRKWPVRREMLRRIKNKFDSLGIEIPFPQRVVRHVDEGEGEIVPINGAIRQQAPVSTN